MTSTARRWQMIDRIFIGGIVVLAAALVWRFPSVYQKIFESEKQDSSRREETFQPPMEPLFESVRHLWTARDIFQSSGTPASAPAAQSAQPAPVDFAQMYRITGIVLGDQPTAIIENVGTESTLFLTVGDALGEAVITDIQENRVLLDHQGQTVELRS